MSSPEASVDQITVPTVRCRCGQALGGLFVILRPRVAADSALAQLYELGDNPYTLALTNAQGHLQLCIDDDPWPAHYAPQLAPHAYKALPLEPYDTYLLRHPDPQAARRAVDELNGLHASELTQGWQPVLRRFEVDTQRNADGTEAQRLELVVDEQPGEFWPRGPARYGGWALYGDMPNQQCRPVQQQVVQLQHELGRMRFVVGDGTQPYVPEAESRDRKGRVANAATANQGRFDARTLAAVLHFQTCAAQGAGLKVLDRQRSFGRASPMASRRPRGLVEPVDASLAYLAVEPAQAMAPLPLRADGVVDHRTGQAITGWLDGGIRNPDRLLVQMQARELQSPDWCVWLGEEAARSLYAWRELTKALGFAQAIQANATYRGVLVDVGHAAYGRSARSIHKVGLAIDTGLKGNYHGVDEAWPILYTRDGKPIEKRDKKGQLIGHRCHWRLYAPTRLNLADAAQQQACALALAAAAADPHPLAAPWLHQAAHALRQALEADPGHFVATHFVTSVNPWNYDAWHDEGGMPGPTLTAAESGRRTSADLADQQQQLQARQQDLQAAKQAMEQQPKPWSKSQNGQWHKLGKDMRANEARLQDVAARQQEQQAIQQGSGFIDLTLLAHLVGLAGIGSFTNMLRPTGTDWGLAAQPFGTAAFKDLADALAQACWNLPSLQFQCQQRDIAFGEVDATFVKAWAQAWPELKLGRALAPLARGSLSRSDAGRAALEQLCALLSRFGSQQFRRLETDQRQTGQAWADELRARQGALDRCAVSDKTDGRQASKAKQPKDWTYSLLPSFGALADAPVEFAPGDTVYLPAQGSPIGMEWWHFQCTPLIDGRTYGQMLAALGFERVATLDERSPQLYHRAGLGYPAKELDEMAG